MRILVALLVSAALTAAVAGDQPVSLQGATTFNTRLIETHRGLIEERAGVALAVVPNKSIHGLKAVMQGRAELAMLSSSLADHLPLFETDEERTIFTRLRSFEIVRSTVAFVVHPDNPVTMLSRDQLAGILTGQITNWKALGGQDVEIKPVMVKEGGGVMLAVQAHVLQGQMIAAPSAARVDTARQVLKAVAQNQGAIGFAQQALAVQSHLPRLQTEVPVEQILSLVSLGEPSARALKVIEAARTVAAERLF